MFILSFIFAGILMVVYIFIATGDLIMEGRAGIPLTGLTLPLFLCKYISIPNRASQAAILDWNSPYWNRMHYDFFFNNIN
jgi:hypothetical protein